MRRLNERKLQAGLFFSTLISRGSKDTRRQHSNESGGATFRRYAIRKIPISRGASYEPG